MKKLFILLSGLCFLSCKSDKEEWAQKAVDRYVIFVDSVNEAKDDKRTERWGFIEQEHVRKRQDALAALEVLQGRDREKEQKRVKERQEKYEALSATISR